MTKAANPLLSTYLDLMRDSLTGRLNQDPPLPASNNGIYKDDYRTNGWDWPSSAPSMIGVKRMQNLREQCERVLAAGIPGDFLEAGVWRGGACIMMRAVLKAYGVPDRRVFAADSFQGPPPSSRDSEADRKADFHGHPDFSVSLDTVKEYFARYGLLDQQVVFLKGWFRDTLPAAPVVRLALLRLDCDLYEGSMDCMNALYGKLSPGGTLIADDYYLFESQREAVDEYRARQGIADEIVKIDDFGAYWIKR